MLAAKIGIRVLASAHDRGVSDDNGEWSLGSPLRLALCYQYILPAKISSRSTKMFRTSNKCQMYEELCERMISLAWGQKSGLLL